MGNLIVLRRQVAPISKDEWRAFWRTRSELNESLTCANAKLRLLKEADREWNRWKQEIFERLAAGAEIEDDGRIAG